MKKYLMALAAAIAFCAVLMLSGCGSRDEDLMGTWVFETNPAWVTTFEENGNGRHAISWGYGTTFTWTTSRGRIIWNYSGHPRMQTEYTINGDVLSITLEGSPVLRMIRQN